MGLSVKNTASGALSGGREFKRRDVLLFLAVASNLTALFHVGTGPRTTKPGSAPTRLSEFCNHTCTKTLENACLNGRGDIVPSHKGATFKKNAILFRFSNHSNPQHVVHEDGYPLFYEVRNCFSPATHDLYLKYARRSRHQRLFADAVVHWTADLESERTQKRKSDKYRPPIFTDLDTDNKEIRCYKNVRVILNPVRTPCVKHPEFSTQKDSLWFSRYQGADGLGLQVNVLRDSKLLPAPPEMRQSAFDVLRKYLTYRYEWQYKKRVPETMLRPRQGRERLNVTVLVRGEDVSKRRQTNGSEMKKALDERFGKNVVDTKVVVLRPDTVLEDQLKTFYMSDVVVAVHGGALGNCVAMRPGTLLVTMCCHLKCQQWEADLAPLVGVRLEKFDFRGMFHEDAPIVNFQVRELLDLVGKHLP